jgi:phosphopantothenoylcysteine decarboxylase / phosphopantothenate---cysteine ligase
MLHHKKILLGVCGSIAAYKVAHLTRLLIKQGAEVKVIMTTSASEFITPLTLSTLSKNPVLSDFVKDKTGQWNNHVELGLWADLFIIAPASANSIAKMATGTCDNLLLATYLSARCPVIVCPAMDLDMYAHPATQNNLKTLTSFGNIIIDANTGELASGLHGQGRMAEPEEILEFTEEFFHRNSDFVGKNVLITAGPTYELIDPVRFIGNKSSGKMGLALVKEILSRGAHVTLVSGPIDIQAEENPNLKIVKVTSASEMYKACAEAYSGIDISIFAAAVADYGPKETATQKIKKNDSTMTLELVKNKDIAYELGLLKKKGQINVGFALETENEKMNAFKKLQKKNFDLIVLNSLNDNGAGFGHDTNKISIIDKDNNLKEFGLKSKKEVARDIVNTISTYIHA